MGLRVDATGSPSGNHLHISCTTYSSFVVNDYILNILMLFENLNTQVMYMPILSEVFRVCPAVIRSDQVASIRSCTHTHSVYETFFCQYR